MRFLTVINIQRLAFLILCMATIYIRMFMLLTCEIVFYLSFEYLNKNTKYLRMPSYRIYNWLFVVFVGFVVLVRSDIFGLSKRIDYHINTLEHLFFSAILCLTTSIYLKVFNILSDSLLKRLIIVFAIFNLIGLLNEFFQNLYQDRPFLSIEGNDIKDSIVNIVGSSMFVLISMLYKSKSVLTQEI
jgi:hypothetical protein